MRPQAKTDDSKVGHLHPAEAANLSPINPDTIDRVTAAEEAIAKIDRLNAEIGAVIDMARPVPPPPKKEDPEDRIEAARRRCNAAQRRQLSAIDLKGDTDDAIRYLVPKAERSRVDARGLEAQARIMEAAAQVWETEAARAVRFLQTLRQAKEAKEPADSRFDPDEPAARISFAFYHAPVSPPEKVREAVELQLVRDLDAAIDAGKARSYWTCGGCRVPHRTRRTANDCQHAKDTIMHTQEIPKVARFAHFPRIPPNTPDDEPI